MTHEASINPVKPHLPFADIMGLNPQESAFQRTHPRRRQEILDGMRGGNYQHWTRLNDIHTLQNAVDKLRSAQGRPSPYARYQDQQPYGNRAQNPNGTTMMMPRLGADDSGSLAWLGFKPYTPSPSKQVVHKPEPIDDNEYSIRDVSRQHTWEGFDPYEIEHLVRNPERARFTLENVPVDSLRHQDEHGNLIRPPTYDEIADQDEDEQERLRELERGYSRGSGVPPAVVVRDGDYHIIADGSHRAAIHEKNGETHMPAFVTTRTIFPMRSEAAAIPDESGLKAAGIAVIAMDTGRVLMLQRALNPTTCPCGQPVTWDESNGWQHEDGTEDHEEDEHYGKTVSDLLDQGHDDGLACLHCMGAGEDAAGHECSECDGSGTIEKTAMPRDNAFLNGLTYKYTAPGDSTEFPNSDVHEMNAYTPDGVHVGHISWGDNGTISYVQTHEDYKRRGLANELHARAWNHSLDNGIEPPDHDWENLSDDAKNWIAGRGEDPDEDSPLYEDFNRGFTRQAVFDYDHNEGVWEFPGGCIEGEPARTAAVREFREEVGQDLPPGVFVGAWLSPGGLTVAARSAADSGLSSVAEYSKNSGFQIPKPPVFRQHHEVDPRALDDEAAMHLYNALGHEPYHGDVQDSYDALERETLAQWHDLHNAGLQVEFHDGFGGNRDYPNSKAMMDDVYNNGHLWTRHSELDGLSSDHPMARRMGFTVPVHTSEGVVQKQATLNDIFRAVHDVQGHAAGRGKEIVGFGPKGEFNAWLRHRTTYSDDALPALWNETRGQAAQLGPLTQQGVPLSDVPFLEQKAGRPPRHMANTDPILDGADPRAMGGGSQYGLNGVCITPGRGGDPMAQRVAALRTDIDEPMRHRLRTLRDKDPREVGVGWNDPRVHNLGGETFYEKAPQAVHDSEGGAHNEVLASLIGRALGANVPATIHAPRGDLRYDMETSVFSRGIPGFRRYKDNEEFNQAVHSRAGKLLGAVDSLVDASDHMNGHNSGMGDNGEPHALDYEGASGLYRPRGVRTTSDFAIHYVEPRDTGGDTALNHRSDGKLTPNPLTARDVERGRAALSNLKPWFDKIAWPDGHSNLMSRWEELGSHASGAEGEDILPEQLPTMRLLHEAAVKPVYKGFIYLIQSEKLIDLTIDRNVVNPDDPDGDMSEQCAWWDIEHAKTNPALRPECKSTPWDELELWADKSVRSNREVMAKLGMGLSRYDTENMAFRGRPQEEHVYLRFGDWPANERSMNHITGYPEYGVSAYELNKWGQPLDPDSEMDRGVHHYDPEECGPMEEYGCETHNRLDGERDEEFNDDTADMLRGHLRDARVERNQGPRRQAHLVTGTLEGFGHDDEPLLRNVKRVGHWPCDVHKFIPGLPPQTASWCYHPDHDEDALAKEASSKLCMGVRVTDLEPDRRQVTRNPKTNEQQASSRNYPSIWNIGKDQYLEKTLPKEMAHNEFLSSMVGRALGADVSPVMISPIGGAKDSERRTIMSRIQPGYRDYNKMDHYERRNHVSGPMDSRRGHLIGLVDALVNVGDHNTINHGSKPDPSEPGGVAPHSIDYENAFTDQYQEWRPNSPYSHHFIDPDTSKLVQGNMLSQRDIARGREALAALRPAFQAVDREEDHDWLMSRWEKIAAHADPINVDEHMLPDHLPSISVLAQQTRPKSMFKHVPGGVLHAYDAGQGRWVHRMFEGGGDTYPMALARHHETALDNGGDWRELGYQAGYPRHLLGQPPEKQPRISSAEWWRVAMPTTQDVPQVGKLLGSGEGSINHEVSLPSGLWVRKQLHQNEEGQADFEPQDHAYFQRKALKDAKMEEFASRLARSLGNPDEHPLVPEVQQSTKESDPPGTVYVRHQKSHRDMDWGYLDHDDLEHMVDRPRGKVMGYVHSILGDADKVDHHNMILVGDPSEQRSHMIRHMPDVSIDHTRSSLPEYADARIGRRDTEDDLDEFEEPDEEEIDPQQVARMKYMHRGGEFSPYAERHFLEHGRGVDVNPKANPLGAGDTDRAVAASETMRPWAREQDIEHWLDAAQDRMRGLGEHASGTETMFPYQMPHERMQHAAAARQPPAHRYLTIRKMIAQHRPEYGVLKAGRVPVEHHDQISDSAYPQWFAETNADPERGAIYALGHGQHSSFLAPVVHKQTGKKGWLRGNTSVDPSKWALYEHDDLARAITGAIPGGSKRRTPTGQSADDRYTRGWARGTPGPVNLPVPAGAPRGESQESFEHHYDETPGEGDPELDEEGHQVVEPRRDTWNDLGVLRGFADEPTEHDETKPWRTLNPWYHEPDFVREHNPEDRLPPRKSHWWSVEL